MHAKAGALQSLGRSDAPCGLTSVNETPSSFQKQSRLSCHTMREVAVYSDYTPYPPGASSFNQILAYSGI